MHQLATVSYTVSQCGRKVCFITSLYSQVTRPCFLKEKKVFASNSTEDVDEREFLGGFCLLFTKSCSFIITTNAILFIKREKKKRKRKINIEKLDWFAINASSIFRDCYKIECFERSLFPLSSLVKFILYSETMVKDNHWVHNCNLPYDEKHQGHWLKIKFGFPQTGKGSPNSLFWKFEPKWKTFWD